MSDEAIADAARAAGHHDSCDMVHGQFYDDEVAPLLLALAEKCQARGMPFLAMVEWRNADDEPESGETVTLGPRPSSKAMLAGMGIRARGNIDALVMAASRHAEKHGHESVVLGLLDLFPAPPQPAPSAPGRNET